MKNKKILLMLLMIALIVAISIFFIIRKNNTNNMINKKGYELFGNEYCSGHGPTNVDGWPSYSTCRICGIRKYNDKPDSDFIICLECSKITGRCTKCGKLLEK